MKPRGVVSDHALRVGPTHCPKLHPLPKKYPHCFTRYTARPSIINNTYWDLLCRSIAILLHFFPIKIIRRDKNIQIDGKQSPDLIAFYPVLFTPKPQL